MRLQAPGRIVSTLALLPLTTLAITLDCGQLQDGGVHWDLKPLGGTHSVSDIEDAASGSTKNTTFVFNICDSLELEGPAHERCQTVCAFERFYDKETKEEPKLADVWPIAGDFHLSQGKGLDAKITRIKHSDSNSDPDKEGVIVKVEGGEHNKIPQRAVIEFVCDRDTTGLDDEDKDGKRRVRRADGEDKDDGDDKDSGDDKKSSAPLKLVSWGPGDVDGKIYDILRLNWRTKYACEDAVENGGGGSSSSKGWGFFTWFIVILFLVVAGYLVFGAWLNYNRYGARGWDLLPHGDTIRDVPYILKDWGRRVVSTVQGGNRDLGGYSGIRM